MQCHDVESAAIRSYTQTTSKPSVKTSQVTWTWAHIFILWQTSWWVSQRGLCTQAENISKWCWAGCCATNRRQDKPLHSVWKWAMWGFLVIQKQTENHSWIIYMYYLCTHTHPFVCMCVHLSMCRGASICIQPCAHVSPPQTKNRMHKQTSLSISPSSHDPQRRAADRRGHRTVGGSWSFCVFECLCMCCEGLTQ